MQSSAFVSGSQLFRSARPKFSPDYIFIIFPPPSHLKSHQSSWVVTFHQVFLSLVEFAFSWAFFHYYFCWSLWSYLCTLLFWLTSWVSGNTETDEAAQRCSCFSEVLPNVLDDSLSSPRVWNRALFLHSGSRGKPLNTTLPEMKNTSDFYFPNLSSLRLCS